MASHPKFLTGWERKENYRKGGASDNRVVSESTTEPLPQSAIESLARALFPQMQVYFESEQGKQALKEWREERARKQLADTNRGIENMLNAIQQGILTSSTKERLEELEKLREELKTSILQAELERPKYSREDIIEWISRFKYGDPNNKEYQRQIIDIFLNSIYVFDDRLVFTYNYKNGTQTVTLKDVSAAFSSDLKSLTPPKETNAEQTKCL